MMRRVVRPATSSSTLRYFILGVLSLFAFVWLYADIGWQSPSPVSSRVALSLKQEDRAVAHLNLPPLANGKSASLSGGHITEELADEGPDLDADSVSDELEFALPGGHPKVALMFLVKGDVPSEPVWRQFLENAGKLQLKAKSFKIQGVNLKKRLKNGLHPTIYGLEEQRYPGYKIQHGLVPPSKYRSTDYPHVKKRRLRSENNAGEEVFEDNAKATGERREPTTGGDLFEDGPVSRTEFIASVKARPVDGWVNSSNAGCKGEEKLIQNRATYLLNGANRPSKRYLTPGSFVDNRYGRRIYESQDLFSVYVHATPGFKFPDDSLFAGLELSDPVNLTNAFALHTLVVAETKLLVEALKEKRNQKFVLLSESCIPVHPPEVIYAQVIHEEKSRINACLEMSDYGRLELWRWKPKMETKSLKKYHWRKSQQWFILNRFHATLVVKDQHVKEVFKRYCWSYGKHICVSDEHYISTLLASYGLDSETDCLGEGTWTNWSGSGWHPKTFLPEQISPKLIRITMNRGWPPCDPLSARRTASRLFELKSTARASAAKLDDTCMEERVEVPSESWAAKQAEYFGNDWTMLGGYVPLGYECPIFARKFPENATAETLNATLSCSGSALGPWCFPWHQSLEKQHT